MSESITDRIFLGNGKRSLAQVEHLHAILDESVSILSGIQQQPAPTEPSHHFEAYEANVLEDEKRIDAIASEIYLGLTGRKPK